MVHRAQNAYLDAMTDVLATNLAAALAERGFESPSVRTKPGRDTLVVDANTIVSLPSDGGAELYAPVPVSVTIRLNEHGDLVDAEGSPEPAALADAAAFVKNLRSRGMLRNDPANPQASMRATHEVRLDGLHRPVVRRITSDGSIA